MPPCGEKSLPLNGESFELFAIRSTVLATFRLARQAHHELARTCTGHDLLSLLLPTTMPHMSGVQDEDSRAECDKMAE